MKKGYHDLFCVNCFLLVYMTLNILNAFELQCPSSKQWIIRSNSKCLIAEGYVCLYDENMNTFAETCSHRLSIIQAGYKFVIVGDLNRQKCESSRYQPFTFSTNGGSTCIFEKTYCSEEGQIIFNNGSKDFDRQCRCDYTRGYDFITKPTHSCYCVPSMEDCSCYQKHCLSGFILSPDYKCINPTSWNSQFTCESILPYHPTDTNFPSHDNNLDDGVTAPARNERIILSIAVGVTILFTLIIVQLTLFCLTKMEERKYVLKENIELKLVLAGEVIPQNIRDLQENLKKELLKKFNHFVETRASKALFERMKKEQCVIISGPFGSGKSSLAFHTALNLEKTLGFDIMIISNPDDVIKYASKDKKQIFLIDDALGKYNVSNNETFFWNVQGESVHQLVIRNTNLRILMTSRLNIYRSCDLPKLKERCCQLNLISKELALSYEERNMIGRCYLPEDIIDNLNEDVVMSYSFFPKLCEMFNTYSNENIVEYFTNPVEYIKTDIQNLQKSSYDMFDLALSVLVLFDNNVHKDIFNDNNHKYDRLLTSVSKEIGYKRYLSKKSLYSSFISLTDSYVSDQDTHFACLHSNLFNALVSCIGPKIIQKTYFERNLLDMKTALHNIFKGSQHLSPEFRESYIAYMKKHLIKKDLRKDIDESTVLHFVSEEGYAEYGNFFLKLDNQMVKCLDNTGQTALHKTCIAGHINAARLLLDNDTYIDQTDNDDKTALDIACDNGLIVMADYLLSRHAKIRQKKTDLRSPLHIACDKSNIDIAELLLKNSAVVNAKDYKGFTPLHIACEKGFVKIAMLLINYKASVEIKDIHGKTPLYIACKNGNLKEAKLLLFNNANVNACSEFRNTPIFIACEKKHTEIIKVLLEYQADVNWKNKALVTPLHVSCQIKNIEIASIFIKNGALVNAQDKNFKTPLLIACSKGYFIALDDVSKHNTSTNMTDQTSDTHVIVSDTNGNEETEKMLLKGDDSVNDGDLNGMIYIHMACQVRSEEIVEMLLNAGANVNGMDKGEMTPLHVACQDGQENIVTMLINAGANLNVINKHGMTPLHVACKRGQEKIVTMLMHAGVNVNKGDTNGLTPLHIACIEGHATIVKVFLNSIANVKMMDKDGMTPLDVACKYGHNDIVILLFNAGANGNRGDENELTTIHMAVESEREVTTNDVSNLDDDVD